MWWATLAPERTPAHRARGRREDAIAVAVHMPKPGIAVVRMICAELKPPRPAVDWVCRAPLAPAPRTRVALLDAGREEEAAIGALNINQDISAFC